MEREAKNIRTESLRMAWYMRGAITYADAMNMCPMEREAMSGIIKENLETTKKSGLPFF